MIPLVLITGFLGSGKTTLVQWLLEQAGSRRLACIVNEFGPVDIDGQLIDLPPRHLLSIPGGSIFCQCLVGEFIRVLREVASLDDSTAPDGVLIEASGMADPKVVGCMLAETGLDRVYELRQIVTVVDPGSFLKLVHTLPSVIAQVQASNLVLLNKTDLYTPGQIEETETCIRGINPFARIVSTRYCRADIDWFNPSCEPAEFVGEYAACRDPNYITRTIPFARPVDRDSLLTELRTLHPHVYRAKGFVPTPAGPVYVDLSVAGVSCEPATRPAPDCQLVVIAAPRAQPAIEAFARRIQPGAGLSILG
jgi:G3E family GTPase